MVVIVEKFGSHRRIIHQIFFAYFLNLSNYHFPLCVYANFLPNSFIDSEFTVGIFLNIAAHHTFHVLRQ